MSGPIEMNEIEAIATKIGSGPLGLVYHQPEAWARPTCCFDNAWKKVELSGGRTRYGWTFHSRIKDGVGEYIFVTHHAVWNPPDGRLIDVTPFHQDPRHHPLLIDGSVLFLVDDKAEPVVKGAVIAPLPLRYFPRGDNEKIVKYVEEMNDKEQQDITSLIDSLDSQ
jgi:hypothetical protein